VKIEFDENKSRKNAIERDLPFDKVAEFDWETALIFSDERFLYPELRFAAFGFIGSRLHFLCYTPTEEGVRVISFRKANQREVKHYEETIDR
jgi:uncharacterized protein